MNLKTYEKLRVAALFILPAVLCGCASNLSNRTLEPELIYTSDNQGSTQLILQKTQHIEHGVFTPEGLKDSVVSSDYKYSIKTADGKTVELPFLDAINSSKEGTHIDHIFYNTANSSWIASGIVLSHHVEHVKGLFEWKRVEDLFIDAHIKAFTKNVLISKKTIEICNVSMAQNPIIQYDKSRSSLRYCGKGGTTVYFPLTKVLKIENSSNCCPSLTEHYSSRYLKDFFEEADMNVTKEPHN